MQIRHNNHAVINKSGHDGDNDEKDTGGILHTFFDLNGNNDTNGYDGQNAKPIHITLSVPPSSEYALVEDNDTNKNTLYS